MLAIGAALLLRLSYEDLRRRRLPNRLVAAYACSAPLALLASGAPAAQWQQQGLVAAASFMVMLIFFVLRGVGGGDVKLGTAVLAWTQSGDLMRVLLAISLTGVVVALLGLLVGAPCLRRMFGKGWLRRVRRALLVQRGVPYGVALATGGLFALPAYLS